jgi:hypothetical protein
VGIGTNTPADLLHVNGNLRGTQLNLTGGILNTTASTTNLSFRTNNTARMTILGSNGYVGIGASNPVNQLQIGPNPNGWGANDLVVANGNGGLAISTNATETYLWGSKDVSIRPGNGVQSIYAKSDGTVGIGTATPNSAYKLDVAGAFNTSSKAYFGGYNQGGSVAGTGSSNGYSLEVGGPNPDGTSGDATIFFHHHGVLGHQLRYNNGNLFLEAAGNGYGTNITPNFLVGGNIAIGTNTPNPAYKLDINGYFRTGISDQDQFLVRAGSGAIGYSEAFLQGQSLGITL